MTGGASIPAQIGAVAAGRGIDALTGRRSAVAKFVKDQQARQGTADPTAQSIRASRALAKQQEDDRKAQEKADRKAAEEAEAQRKRDLAMEATRRNEPPKGDPNDPNPSSKYTMETAAGLLGPALRGHCVSSSGHDPAGCRCRRLQADACHRRISGDLTTSH